MIKQYEAFAAAYDRMMHDCDRERWTDYLDMLLKEYDAHEIMDCACGTGETAIRLYKRGYKVFGNDLSPQMLMEARNRAYKEGCGAIIFICEDIFCGVVPLGADMRAWREMTGRMCSFLSSEAENVTRVFCGLEQVLK